MREPSDRRSARGASEAPRDRRRGRAARCRRPAIQAALAEDDGADEAVLRRAGVRRPYVLFVGTQEPRKAIPDLVAAFDDVASIAPRAHPRDRGRAGLGSGGGRCGGGAASHRERVVRTGYLDDEPFAVLMRRAEVVAYPAFEEGFGLPALEALACATPLVTTSGSAMAEVAGEAALLVAAGDEVALAEAIEEAVRRGPAVIARIETGLVVAASHTWEASARRHLDAYRLAAQ